MVFDWQTIVSLIIVAGATVWMLRRLLATGQGDSSCGSCSSCASNPVATDKQIETATPKRVYQLTRSDR